ncbi:hypothetical protein FNV43_RR10300 [Rhamnella rubrinervis]|uniref:Uncharacterized protein n=1 Tax=Rhamnella rubrinervis TaxID=2594499 RepID=A0A8K0MKK4_9ROSA|nr:hypothetical protein FNV43_RR10300 [Rhamnella rubrinervis]
MMKEDTKVMERMWTTMVGVVPLPNLVIVAMGYQRLEVSRRPVVTGDLTAYQESVRVDQNPQGFLQDSTMKTTIGFYAAVHNFPFVECGSSTKRPSPCFPSSSSFLYDNDFEYDHQLFLDTTPIRLMLPPLVHAPECSFPTYTPNRDDLHRCISC